MECLCNLYVVQICDLFIGVYFLEENERRFQFVCKKMNPWKGKCKEVKAILGVCFKISALDKNVILQANRTSRIEDCKKTYFCGINNHYKFNNRVALLILHGPHKC